MAIRKSFFGKSSDERPDSIGEAFTDLLKAVHEDYTSDDPTFRDTVDRVARRFGVDTKLNHLLTVGSTTITFRLSTLKMLDATDEDIVKIETQLRTILTANPEADVYRYEETLGTTIIDVQRKIERPRSNPGKGFEF